MEWAFFLSSLRLARLPTVNEHDIDVSYTTDVGLSYKRIMVNILVSELHNFFGCLVNGRTQLTDYCCTIAKAGQWKRKNVVVQQYSTNL